MGDGRACVTPVAASNTCAQSGGGGPSGDVARGTWQGRGGWAGCSDAGTVGKGTDRVAGRDMKHPAARQQQEA